MLKVLFTRGLPDDNTVTMGLSNGRLNFVGSGGANVLHAHKYFRNRIRVFETFFIGEGPDDLPDCPEKPDVVFNEISDPDSHGISLGRAEEFCRRLGVPIINHPAQVRRLTRDAISAHFQSPDSDLSGKLLFPKTARYRLRSPEQISEVAVAEEMTFPILVRVAGQHGGKTLVKVDAENDIAPLHSLPMDGRDFYLTEFVDFRSPDGLYRKFRIVVVGGRPHLRHVMIGNDWKVHSPQREFMKTQQSLLDEEKAAFESFHTELLPRIRPMMNAINDFASLDYFGFDANLDENGRLLIFEVNANMNNVMMHKRSFPIHETAVRGIAEDLERLILSRANSPATAG